MNTSLKLILRKTISLIRTRQKLTPCTNSLRLISGCSSQNVYLYDETPGVTIAKALTKYTDRTHTCGDLRLKNVGQKVVLAGWLEFQRMNKFLVLRDAYGHTQLIVDDKNEELKKTVAQLPYESIIKIEGTVAARPEDMKNKNQSTGEIEVLIEKFHVLNKATTLPFNIREFQKANESLRIQYRYLDLRFPTMQRNMRVRSTMLMKMRDFLANKRHFVDVETPTLFKATPGGAQEFVVPTRFPGQFYALVQSPQQFKQMLMAGAIDRYFQIARCYRDESTRSDRQPEFTQLDIEMSFTTANGIMELVEELMQRSWPDFLHLPNFSFRRIPYKKAMETYGTDKPDTRFDCTLNNCTEVFSKFQTTDEHFGAYYLMFPSKSWNFTKTVKTRLKEMNKQYPEAKLVTGKVTTRSDWITSVEKLLGRQLAENLAEKVNLPDDSVFILSYGSKKQVQSLLGKIRLEYAYDSENSGNKVIKNGVYFAWITDFPLFEAGENPGSLNSAHHPFTAPHPDDIHLLAESPLDVRGLAYDLVLNGQEVGGGSIRVHDADLQEKLLHMLKIDKSTLQHMLDMLRSGCPPHGGIALGIDRLIATILDTPSIRDVIAFPKIFEGRDPVSGAPSEISDAEKKLYHIRTVDT